jgi:hypothetical protein
MAFFAPRISPKLVEALVALDDPELPIAEINRRLGAKAELLGLRRPSYQCVRQLVHEVRDVRREFATNPNATTGDVLLDIIFRARPPDAFLQHISGVGVPKRH